MSSDVTQVKGLAELQAALDQLPAKIEANIMRGAMRQGAKVLLAEAKGTAAFADDTGALRASLRITTSVRRGTVTAAVKAGPTKADKRPWYARLVEYGTKPHTIRAKPGSVLQFLGIGATVVNHPGAKARPYLRPALDARSGDAVQAVAAYIRNRLASKHGIDVPAPREEGDE
jgi:HK97 gp10 family phage protein